MTPPGKFQFDRSFDQTLAAAPPPIIYGEDDMAAARAAAHAEGYAEASAEIMQGLNVRQESLWQTIAASIAQLPALFQAEEPKRATDAARIAVALAAKFLPPSIARTANESLDATIKAALAESHAEPRLVLRVPDVALDGVQERLDQMAREAGFAGQIVLLADRTLKNADCRIEWAEGGVARAAEKTWENIERIVADHVRQYGSSSQEAAVTDNAKETPHE